MLDNWIDLAVVMSWTALAVCGTVGSALISPRRTYYPVLRVLLAFIAFLGAYYGALRALEDTYHLMAHHPWTRVLGLLGMAAACAWALWFIHRRNSVPRYLPVNESGQAEMVPLERLRASVETTVSLLDHGDMPREWVPEVERGLARWRQ